MSYWKVKKKYVRHLTNTYLNYYPEDPLVVIDGGAAGKLSEPFNVAGDCVKSIRFEPRGEAAVDQTNNDIYVSGGLWSEDGLFELYVAKDPTTSSICPPNFKFLKQFDDQHGCPPRTTLEKNEVQLRSIDSCVSTLEIPLPNFIKLDVHSAELPALIGGQNSLDKCVGLLIETWHAEVHLQQGLHFQIEDFALNNGFEVYDIVCAARWKNKHNGEIHESDKGRYIGSEILFIRTEVSEDLIAKKALILSLFGFGNAAKNILSQLQNDTAALKLSNAITQMQFYKSRNTKKILKKILVRTKNFFSLYHYR
jgi:FkbM family methyltransferase